MRHWPREEVRAVGVCTFVLIVFVLYTFISYRINLNTKSGVDIALTEHEKNFLREYGERLRSDSIQRARRYTSDIANSNLFAFDPNHADSLILSKLGLSGWQISNMMKYRQMGGRWRSADDFSRLYGLSENDFKLLRPYIKIAPEDRYKRESHKYADGLYKDKIDTLHRHMTKKYPEGTVLELSSADTTVLKMIPGIGSYYAGKIVRYRERLGGFVSVNQLDEIEGLPSGISRWFKLDSVSVKKINLNYATFKQLVHHPYMSYEQTKAVVNHVRKYGPVSHWNDLRLYKEFSDKDFQRLTPYFSLE